MYFNRNFYLTIIQNDTKTFYIKDFILVLSPSYKIQIRITYFTSYRKNKLKNKNENVKKLS